ncbi:exported hypothetical protein [Bradyrhizobium sp. ORS 375]|nr:exported hypothetical protein [Bradyrhizobium sp. ORS 375]
MSVAFRIVAIIYLIGVIASCASAIHGVPTSAVASSANIPRSIFWSL